MRTWLTVRHPHLTQTPLRHRLAIAIVIGVGMALLVWMSRYRVDALQAGGADFDQISFAARAILEGGNPYALIGPGKAMEWPWPLLYPLTTPLALLPLGALPAAVAHALFIGLSSFALAYALGAYGWRLMPILLAFVGTGFGAQWSTPLTAALLVPSLAWVFVLKPHIGAALLVANGSVAAVRLAAIGGVLLLVVSLFVDVTWPLQWFAAMRESYGVVQVAPVAAIGGPALLLALLRWRRWDARLLLALALIPQTPLTYSALPLGLLAQTRMQALLFVLSTHLAGFSQVWFVPRAAPNTHAKVAAACLNAFIYLPCLVAVLRRPNEGGAPAAFERAIARWPVWLRGNGRVEATP